MVSDLGETVSLEQNNTTTITIKVYTALHYDVPDVALGESRDLRL